MSITPKKFNSVDLNSGSYTQLFNGTLGQTSAGYVVDLTDYILYIAKGTGIFVTRKSDYKMLYVVNDPNIFAGAKIIANTIIITKLVGTTLLATLVASSAVVSDTGITFGNELALNTSWLNCGDSVVPIVLENGKILIAGEYYTGTASPYVINLAIYSLTFIAPATLSLFETKTIVNQGTTTTTATNIGLGLNLYKADTNRCILLLFCSTGVMEAFLQKIDVTSGSIVVGAQAPIIGSGITLINGDTAPEIALGGTGGSAGWSAFSYCPFPILCDDPNFIIISTIGKLTDMNAYVRAFIKIRLSDMHIVDYRTPMKAICKILTMQPKISACTIQDNIMYISGQTAGSYTFDKNMVSTFISDSFAKPAENALDKYNLTNASSALPITITPLVYMKNFALYFVQATSNGTNNTYTVAVAKAGIDVSNSASFTTSVTTAMGEVTLVSGETGKTKFVTSILLGINVDYSSLESKIQICLNGKPIWISKESLLLPNSPIILTEGDILTAKCFMGVPRGTITIFGYEENI